jgi:mRNA interferase MazF
MGMVIERFGVYLVALDPTQGQEMRKTRPAVVVSPDELNRMLGTVLIAPLTSRKRPYPFRQNTIFQKREGQVALDQMRVVDKSRLLSRLGSLDEADREPLLAKLQEMFTE